MLIPPTRHVTHSSKVEIAANSLQVPKISLTSDKPIPLFSSSPTFPKEIYETLPGILNDGCKAFQSQRDKDVFLLSAIIILSGCIPAVQGTYNGYEVRANLFGFIVAPPGSGKGVLTLARMLGLALHKHKTELSDQEKKSFDMRMTEEKANKNPLIEPPPPYKTLFIPGNISSAAIVKALKDNDALGVICETEADSLSGTMKQDWGNFSDILRKSFHHEPISYLRKTGERYDIDQPALSVVLAGTPGQVNALIPNPENGLFSRFLFYRYEIEPKWQDVSPVIGRISLNTQFGNLAEKVKVMALTLESLEKVSFDLTSTQWRVLNSFCEDWLETSIDDTAKAISSTIFRLGLIIYRLCMVLSTIHCHESMSLSNATIMCDDTLFSTAISLARVLLDHSKLMFDTMPKAGQSLTMSTKRQKFFEAVPTDFSREQANTVGKAIGVTERSVHNYIERLIINGQLLKTQHGKFKKI